MRKYLLSAISAMAVAVCAAEPVYDGFAVDVPPRWKVFGKSRPDSAFFGRRDSTPRHSAVAVVRISPVAPRRLTMAEVRQAVEAKMKQQETDRIKEVKFTLKETVVADAPALEVRMSCLDKGTTPISRMESQTFLVITPTNRLLHMSVSERSSEVGTRFDDKAAAEFFKAVHW